MQRFGGFNKYYKRENSTFVQLLSNVDIRQLDERAVDVGELGFGTYVEVVVVAGRVARAGRVSVSVTVTGLVVVLHRC